MREPRRDHAILGHSPDSRRFRHRRTAATSTTDEETGDTTLSWIGADERGRELEIIALDRPDCFLVIHVMPTHYRKAGR